MAGIGQYLKETRSELNHVAWPTQTQTIVYTILVAAISLGLAAYLGLFDYIFTTALAHVAGAGATSASNAIQVTQQTATTTVPAQAPATNSGSAAPAFNIPGTTPESTQ
jgi:preprotein translocase SecE subunit